MKIVPKPVAAPPRASLSEFTLDASAAETSIRASEWPPSFATGCCPECGGDFQVKNSRRSTAHGPDMVRRRRVCSDCGYKTTTVELSIVAFAMLLGGHGARAAVSAALRDLADQIDAHRQNGGDA